MAGNNGHFMRSGQHNNKRGRGRNRRHGSGGGGGGGGNYSGGNPGNRVLDSNGPDVKLRGTAQTIAEKYMQLGRDAQLAGDTVMSESYYQHGEHYYRLWLAGQPAGQVIQFSRRPGEDEFEDDAGENDSDGDDDAAPEGQVAEGSESSESGDVAEAGNEPTEGAGQQQRQFRQRDNRDGGSRDGGPRDGNRDGQNRDRNRNRWPRRDRNDQPRDDQEAPRVERPVVAADEPAEQGNWETPTFLTRPMPVVVDEPAPVAEQEAERRPRREPRPRRDAAPVPEDQAD
jgi:hypothetical protein